MDRVDPTIPGKQRVESTAQCRTFPFSGGAEAHTLTGCMDPGISSPGGVRHSPAPKETLEYPLELHLYRATRRLALPTDKAGAVVVERGKEGPAHGPESSLVA
jgi:hypothetical protein